MQNYTKNLLDHIDFGSVVSASRVSYIKLDVKVLAI